jgi:hypothetical protein
MSLPPVVDLPVRWLPDTGCLLEPLLHLLQRERDTFQDLASREPSEKWLA